MIRRSYFIKATRYKLEKLVGYNTTVISHHSLFAEPVKVMQGYVDELKARHPDQLVMIEEFRKV